MINRTKRRNVIKLFVDDERAAPEGWLLAKTSANALTVLKLFHACKVSVDVLSLDHDLSITDGNDDTTRCIVNWMCENEWWPDEIYVHTANSAGEEWLVGTIQRYAPDKTLKGYGMNFWATESGTTSIRHML